jgi:hypothetical protein
VVIMDILAKWPQRLINAVTAEVGTSRHFSGLPTNQDLASQNVPMGLLTRNNCRLARDLGPIDSATRPIDRR